MPPAQAAGMTDPGSNRNHAWEIGRHSSALMEKFATGLVRLGYAIPTEDIMPGCPRPERI